jgi:hypothetical protein
MSRSNQPSSNTEAKAKPSDLSSDRPGEARRPHRKPSVRLAAAMRWLHIYISMFGLAAALFFSVTGLTLNHPDWLAQLERTQVFEGDVEASWLNAEPHTDGGRKVDELRVVEHLRREHGLRGALDEFRVDEEECTVSFKGPGHSADAFIDLDTGHYRLTQISQGIVAVLNDLHKGRHTGPVWSWVIDIVAVLLALISATGLYLIFGLKLRRVSGLVVAVIGTLVLAALVLYGVP